MNKIAMATLAVTLAFATPAFADDAHHPENAAAVSSAPAKSENNISAQTLKRLQENVRQMPSQIDRIANAKTDEERQKAMLEHMQSMQQNMAMMRSMQSGMMACPMMEGGMGMGMGMGMMGEAQSGTQSVASAERMQQMENRLNRMQTMIEKMASRQESQQTTPAK
jgi:hypothetical protein